MMLNTQPESQELQGWVKPALKSWHKKKRKFNNSFRLNVEKKFEKIGSKSRFQGSIIILRSGYSQKKLKIEQDSCEREFLELVQVWEKEVGHLSSTSRRCMHPSYQRIIGMGLRAVPFLLREMRDDPNDWFWALTSITGDDPTNISDAGNLEKCAHDWLSWANGKGINVPPPRTNL